MCVMCVVTNISSGQQSLLRRQMKEYSVIAFGTTTIKYMILQNPYMHVMIIKLIENYCRLIYHSQTVYTTRRSNCNIIGLMLKRHIFSRHHIYLTQSKQQKNEKKHELYKHCYPIARNVISSIV